jgi:cysteinyl-tRNA synthetase
MPLRVFNSLRKAVEVFTPADPSRITFYSCGPTVYDDAHIGNFRSFLAADVLRRWLESPLCSLANDTEESRRGRKVTHVMNITDVGHMTDDAEGGESGEDRMAVAGRRLAEAKKSGKIPEGVRIDPGDPYQIARFYEDRFKEDARSLGLKLVLDADRDPTLMPRATASVPGMIEVIQRLIARGNAYVAGPAGSRVVYFSVQTFPAYGRLSGNTLDKLREGAGGRVSGDNQAQKKHPADFLLWKEDPSHIMKWDSPWGAGYPGWHIECTVMSVEGTEARRHGGTKGDQGLGAWTVPDGNAIIDVHSGGEDNIFPHHECEIAQTCCAFNADPSDATFARLWFHPRFLLVEGAKMSKSKGNFFTARDLFARGIEPAALRLELIKTHYRSNANFTMQGLADSQRQVDRWRRIGDSGVTGLSDSPGASACEEEFAAAMNDDLNIAGAIAAVNRWSGAIETPTAADRRVMRMLDDVLGVMSLARPKSAETSIGLFMDGLSPDPAAVAKLEERRAARAAKDFAKSDIIRDELAAMGYAIKDVAGGRVEVRRR